MVKEILKGAIFITQMIAICCWCFFLGSAFAGITLIIGFAIGYLGGGWYDFLVGLFWCLAHFVSFPFSWLYKSVYGVDDWYESEVFNF
jgi:hypothetical protein